jgi:hypothetical protein
VETLARWGTQALVTLLDDSEMARLRLHALPGLLSAAGIPWYSAPLALERAAWSEFESVWSKIGPVLRDILMYTMLASTLLSGVQYLWRAAMYRDTP